MKIVEFMKTVLEFDKEKFEAEKKSLEIKNFKLSEILCQIMKEYRSFNILSPSTLREASERVSGIGYGVRSVFEHNNVRLDDVDVVPRREYLTLVESYNRINDKYLEFIEKAESEKIKDEAKTLVEKKPSKIKGGK